LFGQLILHLLLANNYPVEMLAASTAVIAAPGKLEHKDCQLFLDVAVEASFSRLPDIVAELAVLVY
jgi:hypothetical protein